MPYLGNFLMSYGRLLVVILGATPFSETFSLSKSFFPLIPFFNGPDFPFWIFFPLSQFNPTIFFFM